jgi:hypothetical protein
MMAQEEFDLEFPHGSLKRQEEISRLEHLEAEGAPEVPVEEVTPVESPDDGKIPEALWRGTGA